MWRLSSMMDATLRHSSCQHLLRLFEGHECASRCYFVAVVYWSVCNGALVRYD
jgi:hypothetical protein